jgi:phosphatidylethanolamine-binding protein (PEBP) family uncharacterized protein
MKKIMVSIMSVLFAVGLTTSYADDDYEPMQVVSNGSSNFSARGNIGLRYTTDSKSPPLIITNIPRKTKFLAITMTNETNGRLNWTIVNIPYNPSSPATLNISGNIKGVPNPPQLPKASQAFNASGGWGYAGPDSDICICNTTLYTLTVYALNGNYKVPSFFVMLSRNKFLINLNQQNVLILAQASIAVFNTYTQ